MKHITYLIISVIVMCGGAEQVNAQIMQPNRSPVNISAPCQYPVRPVPYPTISSVFDSTDSAALNESMTFFYTIRIRTRVGQASACHDIRMLRESGYPAFISYNQFTSYRDSAEEIPFYSIHTGSFKNAANANRMIETLERLGFPSFIADPAAFNQDGWHRVFAGVFTQRQQAVEHTATLKQNGLKYNQIQSFHEPLYNICVGHLPDLQAAQNTEAFLKQRGFASTYIERTPYSLQMGMFDNEREIAAAVNRLQEKGWVAYLLPFRTNRRFTRVMVGAARLKEELNTLIIKLQTDGFDPQIGIR